MTLSARLRVSLLQLDATALRRGVVAGTGWGIIVAAGLTAVEASQCGVICLDAAAFTALISSAVGIVTIGPLAALGRAKPI